MELTIEIFKESRIRIVEQHTYYNVNYWYSDPITTYDGLFVFQRGRPEFQTNFSDMEYCCPQALFIQGRSVDRRNDFIYFPTEQTMMDVISKLFHCFDTIKIICKTHRIMLKGV